MSQEERLKKFVKHYFNGRVSETEFKDALSSVPNLEKVYHDMLFN